jgi:hypothetical protein|tara:strand:- start:23 stop:205 length:183 start_codon:yes stop_codon:yes gene_type:complete
MKSNLIDFISKENDKKLLTNKEKALLRARKEVNINGNGTTGYKLKSGRVLKHIQIPTKNL